MSTETLQGFQLSPQQKHLWLSQANGNTYLSQAVIEIKGRADLAVLQAAMQKIIDRQEILRTNFYQQSGVSIPFQVIAETNTAYWQTIELQNLDQQAINTKLAELLRSEKSAEFNLERDSLIRLMFITLDEGCQYLIVTLPSLCTDSQTVDNLVRELSQSYSFCQAGKEFEEDSVQYIQFSEWQNELLTEETEELESGQDYWQQQQLENQNLILSNELNSEVDLNLESGRHSEKIASKFVDKLCLAASRYDRSLADLLLACWYILIYKLTNKSEIAIANLFTSRKYEELEETFGLLSQFLPVYCTVYKEFTFSEILSSIVNNLNQAKQYQESYLRVNGGELDAESYLTPLIGFEFEQLPSEYNANEIFFSVLKKDIQLENFKIKLTCQLQQDGLTTEFKYDNNKFDSETIALIAQQFHTLIESALNNPEATVAELNILDSQQRHQLIVEFNDTIANYPQDQCIHQLFEAQAVKTPNNIAVVCDAVQLTYGELNQQADILAGHLIQLGVKPDTLVALYLDRSPLSIVGLLGILKAGAAYLPLDSALPTEGLAFRLQDAEAPILLTQRSLSSQVPANAEYTTICLDTDWETIRENQGALSDAVKAQPNSLVYAIYTSGSTGTPKAVAVEHRQLVNYFYSIVERLELLPGASFATVSTLAADLGNTMLFPALCTGGCLHIINQEIALDAQACSQYCQEHPIDYLKIVPSYLSALLFLSTETGFLPRKKLILGGEASNWQLINKVHQQQPECQIFNHYGPTETTVGVLTYSIDLENEDKLNIVPIGKPLGNNQVYVLDEQLQPVPIGIPGELYIGGMQVSRGYLNRPELTKEKFISNPFYSAEEKDQLAQTAPLLYKTGDLVKYLADGNIEFLGRVDRQVKIRGFRIELGEIESVLEQQAAVRQAVVKLQEDNQRLISYITAEADTAHPSSEELREFLAAKLPEYAIPAIFIALKELPLTANGKIDRQRLPAPETVFSELTATFVAPQTDTEKAIAEIWSEVLGIEQVGTHHNFFQLGGHSLLVTQAVSRIRETFQTELSMRQFFDAPTVAGLTTIIAQNLAMETEEEVLAAMLAELEQLPESTLAEEGKND
ncbi:MAG: amino acid adenylation domain-containing protein [Cyanobacteria bacterium J06621_8]